MMTLFIDVRTKVWEDYGGFQALGITVEGIIDAVEFQIKRVRWM